MPSFSTNIPGVSINPQFLRERVEFTCEAVSYPSLEPGDLITIDGRELRVEQATFYSDGTARVEAVVPLAIDHLPIRSSVRAHRRAVELLRNLTAEKFPGVEFCDEFIFNLVVLTRHISNVTAARMIAQHLNAAGLRDDRLEELTERAAEELSHQFGETFRLWPGASEGKPHLPHADQ